MRRAQKPSHALILPVVFLIAAVLPMRVGYFGVALVLLLPGCVKILWPGIALSNSGRAGVEMRHMRHKRQRSGAVREWPNVVKYRIAAAGVTSISVVPACCWVCPCQDIAARSSSAVRVRRGLRSNSVVATVHCIGVSLCRSGVSVSSVQV